MDTLSLVWVMPAIVSLAQNRKRESLIVYTCAFRDFLCLYAAIEENYYKNKTTPIFYEMRMQIDT